MGDVGNTHSHARSRASKSDVGATASAARTAVTVTASPECPICLGGPLGLDLVLLTPCSHQFCRPCISMWATKERW